MNPLKLPIDLSAPAAVIVVAFLILGVLHGAELLGIVTIPLLQEIERKVDRLGELGSQHLDVARRIAAKVRGWWKRSPH
jgi:hypothetical protein